MPVQAIFLAEGLLWWKRGGRVGKKKREIEGEGRRLGRAGAVETSGRVYIRKVGAARGNTISNPTESPLLPSHFTPGRQPAPSATSSPFLLIVLCAAQPYSSLSISGAPFPSLPMSLSCPLVLPLTLSMFRLASYFPRKPSHSFLWLHRHAHGSLCHIPLPWWMVLRASVRLHSRCSLSDLVAASLHISSAVINRVCEPAYEAITYLLGFALLFFFFSFLRTQTMCKQSESNYVTC